MQTISKKLTPYWLAWHEARESLGLTSTLSNAALESKLQKFYELLLEWNQRMNLTRITGPEGFLYRHILDSLLVEPFIPKGGTVCDVGSGAGFPALPLAIMRPDIQVTAIESVGKKCDFIKHVAEELAFTERLTVLNTRAETVGQGGTTPSYREHFDVITARAVSRLSILLELTVPLAKPGGFILAIKGSQSYQSEVESARKAFKILDAELTDTQTFSDPEQAELHLNNTALLIITKLEATAPRYPRNVGTPSKNPL